MQCGGVKKKAFKGRIEEARLPPRDVSIMTLVTSSPMLIRFTLLYTLKVDKTKKKDVQCGGGKKEKSLQRTDQGGQTAKRPLDLQASPRKV